MLYRTIVLVIFVLDRFTKYYAVTCLYNNMYYVNNYLSFSLLFNTGVSWGIASTDNAVASFVLTVSLCVITLYIARYAYYYTKGYVLLGYTAICAGSVSNIIDRLMYPGVVDFIALRYKNYSFPLFNIADMAIVIGVIMVVISSYCSDDS
jgi:signal peptidase II